MGVFNSKQEKSYKEYCLIGLNRFNIEIGLILMKEGHKVVVLDKDKEKINNIGRKFHEAIVCNCENINELEEVGIQIFDYVILGITNMETSVITAANLKELNVANIMCKARDEKHKRILQFLGIDISFIPEEEVATKIAYKAIYDLHVEWLTFNDKMKDILMIKIPVLNPNLWGKKIKDIDFIKEIESIIISVEKDKEIKMPVTGEDIIPEKSTVCILCNKKHAKKAKSQFSK